MAETDFVGYKGKFYYYTFIKKIFLIKKSLLWKIFSRRPIQKKPFLGFCGNLRLNFGNSVNKSNCSSKCSFWHHLKKILFPRSFKVTLGHTRSKNVPLYVFIVFSTKNSTTFMKFSTEIRNFPWMTFWGPSNFNKENSKNNEPAKIQRSQPLRARISVLTNT